MLEKIKYTNSFGETLDFGKDHLFVNENDLRDFTWGIITKNNKIAGFKKGIVDKTIPIILKCDSEAEGIELRNRLFEIFEKDIIAQKHGKIHIGDYYMQCYITGSQKTNYLFSKDYMTVKVSVQTDFPVWIKETTTMHRLSASALHDYLDYPYDYSYDFKNPTALDAINNADFVGSNFILTIFGGVQNPTLYVGNHKYAVNVLIPTDAYLIINSMNKTIVLTQPNGEKVNCFNNRDKQSYVFEKIPAGTSIIASPIDQLRFQLTLLEERSEPKWT